MEISPIREVSRPPKALGDGPNGILIGALRSPHRSIHEKGQQIGRSDVLAYVIGTFTRSPNPRQCREHLSGDGGKPQAHPG